MAYKSKINKFTGQLQLVLDGTLIKFKTGVATSGDLPSAGNLDGDARIVNDTGNLYVWNDDEGSWEDQGDILDLDWDSITNGPTSTKTQIDSAVTKSHDQNTDTKLDEGGANEVTAAAIKTALDTTIPSKFDKAGSIETLDYALYQFNNSILDSSQNSRDLSIIGNPSSYVTGYFGNAIDLTGGAALNSALKIENTTDFGDIWSNSNFTVDFWSKWDGTANTQTFMLYEYATQYWRAYITPAGEFTIHLYTSGYTLRWAITAAGFNTTNWKHIAICKVGTNLGVYLNGTLMGHASISDYSVSNAAGDFYMGYNTANSYGGSHYMDEARFIAGNPFNANPDSGLTNSIQIPTQAYTTSYLENDIKDTILQSHTQNTDTILDKGGTNEISAENLVKGAIQFVIDGGGSAITDNEVKGSIKMPFDCTITGAYLLADQTGSIQIEVWKDILANYPPTNGDKITDTNPLALSSETNSTSTLTGWTTSISAGDVLSFHVVEASVASVTRVTVILDIKKV